MKGWLRVGIHTPLALPMRIANESVQSNALYTSLTNKRKKCKHTGKISKGLMSNFDFHSAHLLISSLSETS